MATPSSSLTIQQLAFKTDPDTMAKMTQAYAALRQQREQHHQKQRQAAQRWWRGCLGLE